MAVSVCLSGVTLLECGDSSPLWLSPWRGEANQPKRRRIDALQKSYTRKTETSIDPQPRDLVQQEQEQLRVGQVAVVELEHAPRAEPPLLAAHLPHLEHTLLDRERLDVAR